MTYIKVHSTFASNSKNGTAMRTTIRAALCFAIVTGASFAASASPGATATNAGQSTSKTSSTGYSRVEVSRVERQGLGTEVTSKIAGPDGNVRGYSVRVFDPKTNKPVISTTRLGGPSKNSETSSKTVDHELRTVTRASTVNTKDASGRVVLKTRTERESSRSGTRVWKAYRYTAKRASADTAPRLVHEATSSDGRTTVTAHQQSGADGQLKREIRSQFQDGKLSAYSASTIRGGKEVKTFKATRLNTDHPRATFENNETGHTAQKDLDGRLDDGVSIEHRGCGRPRGASG